MITMDKADPRPIEPAAEDEQSKLWQDRIEEEDRWVKDFIDRLAGVIRDMEH